MMFMATVVTVQADSQAEAEAELARLCAADRLLPLAKGRAMPLPGRNRWMARAEKPPEVWGEQPEG